MGALSHSAMNQYREYIGDGVAVEVGCSVPDKISSSQWFGNYFSEEGIEYHGFDVVENIVETLNRHFAHKPEIYFHLKDWKEGFKELTKPIAFAYLDSFDYIPPGMEESQMIKRQRPLYKQRGTELTNENSEDFHLELAQWVHERAADKCLILLDDTFKIEETKTFAQKIAEGRQRGHTYEDGWFGKGRTAIPWLESQGWRILPRVEWPRDDWVVMTNCKN